MPIQIGVEVPHRDVEATVTTAPKAADDGVGTLLSRSCRSDDGLGRAGSIPSTFSHVLSSLGIPRDPA